MQPEARKLYIYLTRGQLTGYNQASLRRSQAMLCLKQRQKIVVSSALEQRSLTP
jgi:hypothetical protein